MKFSSIVAATTLALAAGSANVQANLVTNGDFSSGLSNWTEGLDYNDGSFVGQEGWFNAGSKVPKNENNGQGNWFGSLTTTVALPALTTYNVSFSFWGDPTSNTSSKFYADFGSTRIFSQNGAGLGTLGTPTRVSGTWAAVSGDTLLTFTFRNTAAKYHLDNVSVTVVPEPETYAMMIAGLGLLGFVARRRLKSPQA